MWRQKGAREAPELVPRRKSPAVAQQEHKLDREGKNLTEDALEDSCPRPCGGFGEKVEPGTFAAMDRDGNRFVSAAQTSSKAVGDEYVFVAEEVGGPSTETL